MPFCRKANEKKGNMNKFFEKMLVYRASAAISDRSAAAVQHHYILNRN